jgi:hypothetical protein
MHARHYSMLTGRFLSVDPLEGDPIAPQSFNLYGYVRNRPLTATDPTGLWTCTTDDCITVTTPPWQFAPGADTGLWGLGALQSGSLQFQNGFGAGGGFSVPDRSPADRTAQSAKAGGKRCPPYWTLVGRRFKITHNAVPGLLSPIGISLATSGTFARMVGTPTLLEWAGSGFRGLPIEGAAWAVETPGWVAGGAATISAVGNWLSVGAAWTAGVGIGSMLGAGVDKATGCVEAP